MKNKIYCSLLLIFSICLFSIADNYRNFIEKGVLLLQQGKGEQALSFFEKARRENPENAEPYYLLANCYFAIGNPDKALSNYQKALELNPNNPDYHYSLAFLYLAAGEEEKALDVFKKVIQLSPQSLTGQLALKQKLKLEKSLKEEEITKGWIKREEDERRRIQELTKEKSEGKTSEKTPSGPGMPGVDKTLQKVSKIPVDKLIKRLKFGTDSKRIASSKNLILHDSEELQPYVNSLLALLKKEKIVEVRINTIKAIGQSATKEGAIALLNIMSEPGELFELKLVALESLGETKEEEIIGNLRNALKTLVDRRITQRQEAKKNLSTVNQKIDNLEVQQLTLNGEIQSLKQKQNEMQGKLRGGMEFGMPPGMAPPPGFEGREEKPLKLAEIKKLQQELIKIKQDIKEKNQKLESIKEEMAGLQEKKREYETLLSRKFGEKIASAPSFRDMPPGFRMPQVEEKRQTDEGKNEQIFALRLIKILGKLRDKESLPVIKNAWKEYGAEDEKIDYGLTLARLEDYSSIKMLINRLKKDYPQRNKENELILRSGIIEVAGNYIKTHQDEELEELLRFLSEDSEYGPIKKTASNAISSLKKPKESTKIKK